METTLSSAVDSERQQFLENRKSCIGGSDVAAICGLTNPKYSSPMTVWMEKTGRSAGPEDNENMFWGRKMEALVAEVYSERTGRKVVRRGFRRHKDYPWIGVHIDRMVLNENGLVECKTAGEYMNGNFGEEGTDDIPDGYVMQGQVQMEVFSRDWVDYPVLIGGNRMPIYRALRNQSLFDNALPILDKFWNYNVKKDIPPDPDGSEACAEALRVLYPNDSGIEMVSDNHLLDEAASEYLRLKIEEKQVKAGLLSTRNIITAEMGDASTLSGMGYRATYKRSRDGFKFNSKLFLAENAELAQKYMVPNPGSRRLLVKGLDDGK